MNAVRIALLLLGAGAVSCTPTTASVPIRAELGGEELRTTVDSEIAAYYLEHYREEGTPRDPGLHRQLDAVERSLGRGIPDRETLARIASHHSVDLAALLFADRLWAVESNRTIQSRFAGEVERLRRAADQPSYADPERRARYAVLFVPGWDYAENGPVTGADLAAPRRLISAWGLENHFVDLPPNGAVEENALRVAESIRRLRRPDRELVVVGPSSAGPAIHLALGGLLSPDEATGVAAWLNLGGIVRGSPVLDHFRERWPERWLLGAVAWWEDWDCEALVSMTAERGRARFERLALPSHLLVVTYLGLSLSGELGPFARDLHPILAPLGPNDGLTLLADAVVPGGLTIVAPRSDLFFAEDPEIDLKTLALAETLLAYLDARDPAGR